MGALVEVDLVGVHKVGHHLGDDVLEAALLRAAEGRVGPALADDRVAFDEVDLPQVPVLRRRVLLRDADLHCAVEDDALRRVPRRQDGLALRDEVKPLAQLVVELDFIVL